MATFFWAAVSPAIDNAKLAATEVRKLLAKGREIDHLSKYPQFGISSNSS